MPLFKYRLDEIGYYVLTGSSFMYQASVEGYYYVLTGSSFMYQASVEYGFEAGTVHEAPTCSPA